MLYCIYTVPWHLKKKKKNPTCRKLWHILKIVAVKDRSDSFGNYNWSDYIFLDATIPSHLV